MKPRPCLRCGYCCKKAPCTYGSTFAGGACLFLVGSAPGNYSCGIADRIDGAPGSELSPAFGAGCCSPCNSDRRRLAGS